MRLLRLTLILGIRGGGEVFREVVESLGELLVGTLEAEAYHFGDGGLPACLVLSGGEDVVGGVAFAAEAEDGVAALAHGKFGVIGGLGCWGGFLRGVG